MDNNSISQWEDKSYSVRWALAGLSLSMIISSLGTSISNVALPTLSRTFNTSFQHVQWIVIGYLLAITTLIVSVGRLGDMIGRKRLLLTGLSLFTIASVLCGIAPAFWWLLTARLIQGLGAAIMMALTMTFVAEITPKEKTGSVMGLLGTSSAIGTALGPSLGGFLIAGLSWRAIFLVNVPLGILAFYLAFNYLPADRQKAERQRPSFDTIGTVLLMLTLTLCSLAVTVGSGHFTRLNMILFLGAVAGGFLFVFAQTRAKSPLIQLAAFGNITLSSTLIMNMVVSTVMMSTLVVGPFFLTHALGLNDASVGLVMSVGPILSALSGVPAGKMVDRNSASSTLILALILLGVGCFMLSTLPVWLGVPGYIAAIVILTPGYQLFQASNNTAVMMRAGTEQRGVISGLLNLSRNLGLIIGASVMGALFSFAARTSDMTSAQPEAVATGMSVTFIVAGFLIILVLVLAKVTYLPSLISKKQQENIEQ
jgi:EmrB/QacA subfamily drug resistance transporter